MSKRKSGIFLILIFLFMPFTYLFNIHPSTNSSDVVINSPLTTLDQSWDSKDIINGFGNNVTLDLFLENLSSYSDFKVQNSFLSFGHNSILDLPQIAGYKIYKVEVNIDNTKNLTAESDYISPTTGIAQSTALQERVSGFEPQMAGQIFNLPYRSLFYNASIYMAVSGLYGHNNGTVELYNDSTKTTLLDVRTIPIVSLGSAVWHNYTYNTILNDSGQSYEIILNGTNIGATGRFYYWYHPTAGAITYDGEVKLWDLSWAGSSWNHTLIYCYLPLSDGGTLPRNFTADETLLKINNTLVGNDNTIVIQQDGITHLDFSTNISCRINSMNMSIFYIRENQEAKTSYEGVVNQATVNWNITINTPFVSNCINGTYGINITIPSDWTVQTILNGTPLTLYDASQWIQLNGLVSIKNASSGSHPWILNCTAPNYLNQITVEKMVAPSTYVNITDTLIVNITETIRINGTLINSIINSGDGNLTIFDPSDVANYSQVEDANPPVDGVITFNDWVIGNNATTNGTYTIQVVWFNGTEVGIRNILLEIIHHTESVLYVEDELQVARNPELFWFIGLDNIKNVTIFYNRTFLPTGISTPNATYNIVNDTGGLWQPWTALDNEALGTGLYNVSLDISSWLPGKYYMGINLNLSGYLTQIRNITLNLVYNTSIALIEPAIPVLSSIYPENLTISLNYSRIGVGIITDATVEYYLNGTGPQTISYNGTLFAIQLNSTDLEVGTHNITIIASKFGHYTRQLNINWTINPCPTAYQLFVNATVSATEFYYGRYMNITVYYNDTQHGAQGWPIENAPINLTLIGVGLQAITSQGNGWYTWIFNSSDRPAGLWNFSLSVEKPNYQNHTQDLELYARYNTSLAWINAPPDQINPGDTLGMSVNLTRDGAPLANQNITFRVITNLGTYNETIKTHANGSAYFGNYFILSDVTDLRVEVIFEGNVTDFSSSSSKTLRVVTGGFLEQYWWVIVILIALLVVGYAAARSRRKSKVAKQVAKKEILTSFQDVTKIMHLVVIHKGTGTDIFDYKVQERLDPTLLAGFIQAVKDFGRELDQEGR